MKVNEIISEAKEGKLTKRQLQSTKGVNIFNDGPTWASDYGAYRLGMAVASTDGKKDPEIDAESYIGKKKMAYPYSKEEQEMLKKAYKAVGLSYKDPNKGDMESRELDTTNKASPVAKPKKNRFGV
jgi:hypothetical protein